MSVYTHESATHHEDIYDDETTIEEWDNIYWRCKKTKSRSCIINFWGEKRKVYYNDDDTLTINCKKDEEDENGNWRLRYIKLNRGLYECENCHKHFNELNDNYECRECCYSDMIYDWKLDMVSMRKKRKDAVKFISKLFLECKYNPDYKYCRDRMNDLYDREYDEDYVEGEKIFKQNLMPKHIYNKWYQNI